MKKSVAKKWCEALRSGEYKQGKAKLHDPWDNTYCCLGVLNEVFNLRETHPKRLIDTFKGIGLSSPSGAVGDSATLAGLNDSGLIVFHDGNMSYLPPFTFDEIADVIQIEYIEGIY